MNTHYPPVAERARHRCEYCHAPEAVFNVPFEVDHVIPLGRGGQDGLSNFALACRVCNLRKSDTTGALDPATNRIVPLFNPRTQAWEEHFEVRVGAEVRLRGKTPTGRATVEQLRMNSELQLEARALWTELGIFP